MAMTNKKTTKKALIMSVLSLVLCFTMLLGTTYAWFTDSVASTNNRIVAGNLDVELQYSLDTKDWKSVDSNTNIFTDSLWEPGHTEVVYLRVSNVGSLALKYQLGINIESEKAGMNVAGEPFKLSDYIMFGVADPAANAFADRAAAITAVKDTEKLIRAGYSKSSTLYAKGDNTGASEAQVALVVYMPETVGNEANYMTGTNPPEINLGINLFATQFTYEEDSFGPDYDKDAAWTGGIDTAWYTADPKATEYTIDTAEELAGLAAIVNGTAEGIPADSFEGKTITLAADIDLRNAEWTPIGKSGSTFKGAFIGTGYTIYNLNVIGTEHVGLFGATFTGAHIEGVTVENAFVSGNDYVGVILGGGYLGHNCIVNCTVIEATVIASPYQLADGTYDGGAKAGVIAGQAYNGNITGCTVKDSTVIAYRDLGAIAGMLDFDGTNRTIEASGNTAENVKLGYVGVAGKYDGNKPNQNMAAIVGRVGSKAIVDEAKNTVIDVTMDEGNKGVYQINNLEELLAFVKTVNEDGVMYSGKTVTLGADIDLANMNWTPIAQFNGIFDGQGHTISNLKINMAGKNDAGFFANTSNGEIKNVTFENASVTGRLWVGVVAGTPYTSKYTNVTVTGHVEVNGMSYVGGVGGKNAYANWTDITVNVDNSSYVKAVSTENGTAYRTYVGGVVGFNGEGGHTFKNITSNINVIGDVCDIGGAFGIAHYNNKFENVTVTGNVSCTGEADEIGGIAGVWHNQNGTSVSFTNCKFSGTVSDKDGAVTGCDIVGGKYGSGNGVLIIRNYYEADGVTYYTDGVTGDVVLSKVSEDAPAKLVIPDNVTVLGGKALQGNTTVKEVVIPSSVKDFGGAPYANGTGASGGMFYQSAVEKIVLPEGLTEIPAAAFNQATALKSVNIPDSVEKIGINAFAGCGLTELVITNNVKEIGYGAFRDMDSLTTATIDGDVYIPDYAFRDCSNLKDVYLNGVNVTFGSNMIFTVTSTNNENPNGITVHVANDAIKARLEATGQFKGTIVSKQTATENGYYMDDNGNALAYDAEDMVAALEDGKDVVLCDDTKINPAGMSNSYGTTGINVKNGQTIDGGGNILDIKGAGGTWDSGINTTGGLIKNLTVTGSFRGIFINHNSTHSEPVVLENVIIDGTTYTISCDQGMYQTLTATNSTFNGWTSYAATLGNAKFVDCSFGEGSGYAFCRPYAPTEFVNCDFEAGFRMDPRAAVTFENCTIGGVALTAENLSDLVISNIDKASVK